jgi:hypothetical protein
LEYLIRLSLKCSVIAFVSFFKPLDIAVTATIGSKKVYSGDSQSQLGMVLQ